MYKNKTIAVVVPAYNEEQQITMVVESMPDFVDRIIIVDDCSTDKTVEVVQSLIDKAGTRTMAERKNGIVANTYNRADIMIEELNREEIKFYPPSEIVNNDTDDRLVLIKNLTNTGVGGAIARGYKWCKDYDIDCTAVMAGDGQMDPYELESLIKPIIEEGVDYTKGNRLIHKSAALIIPRTRFFGNSVLSILTKIASGYWHISDTQCGYTAISKNALNSIQLHKIYKRYGMPNDLLVKLNISFCTIKEIPIKPVYNIGEKSKMKPLKVIHSISWLLLKSFFKRLWSKYLLRDFHPLFLLYNLSFLLFVALIPFLIHIFPAIIIPGRTVSISVMFITLFLFISSFQSLLFAMWMDIQDNERLYKI